MVYIKKLVVMAGAALLCAAAGVSFAQTPPPAPPPPPDPAVVDQVFKMIDKNGDGVLQPEEIRAWVKQAMSPGPNGEPAGMMLMQPMLGPPPPPPPPAPALPEPPPCSADLISKEQTPFKTGIACNGKEGNLIYRTVCNSVGYDVQAITLPAGRAAGCFKVHAKKGNPVFGIRVEGGADVYRSDTSPMGALAALLVEDTTPSATGKYQVYLDTAASSPDARITVQFVDYPK
ncbi:MAG: hypothetical protein EXS64_12825 [Candidatus Latescibacteria bacterium]|nr:hypothetical protein [Candidatus Latescibacterota bacterium]